MTRLQIDIDYVEAERKQSIRERVGLYILFAMFRIIYPAKFSSQVDKLENAILGSLENNKELGK